MPEIIPQIQPAEEFEIIKGPDAYKGKADWNKFPKDPSKLTEDQKKYILEGEKRMLLSDDQMRKVMDLREGGFLPKASPWGNGQAVEGLSQPEPTPEPKGAMGQVVSQMPSALQSVLGLATGFGRGTPGGRFAESIGTTLGNKITGKNDPSIQEQISREAPMSAMAGEKTGDLAKFIAGSAAGAPLAKAAAGGIGLTIPENIGFILSSLGKLGRGAAVGGLTGAMDSPGALPSTKNVPAGIVGGLAGETLGIPLKAVGDVIGSSLASRAGAKALKNIGESTAKVGLPMEEGIIQKIGSRIQEGNDLAGKNLKGAYGNIKNAIFGAHGEKPVPPEVMKDFAGKVFDTFSAEQTNPEIANAVGDVFNKASKPGATLNDLAGIRKDISNIMKGKGEWRGVFGKLHDAAKGATDETLSRVAGTDVASGWKAANSKYSDAMDVLSRLNKATDQNLGGFMRDKLPSETYRQTVNLVSKNPEFIDKALATNPELQKPLADTIIMDIAQQAREGKDVSKIVNTYGKDRLSKVLPKEYYMELMDNVGKIDKAKDKAPLLSKLIFKTLLQSASVGAGAATINHFLGNKKQDASHSPLDFMGGGE